MNDPFYNFPKVLDAVHSQVDDLIRELFPDAKKANGCFRVGSIDGEKGRSLSISARTNNAGCFTDHSDPSIKGNAIALVAHAKSIGYQEAGIWLAKFLGIPPEERLYMPKKRPKPIIKKDEIKPLSKRSVEYAKTRGISEETLRKFKCASTETHIVFPHFNIEGETVMVKYWSCDGEKNIFTNENPIPVLFGKDTVDPMKSGGSIIITEGQWDAMTWSQLGYPAVSIPSGASNDQWIEEDWIFLNQFSEIYLDFDDDIAGREAEQRARTRIGYERCRSIKYRFKDANQALCLCGEEILHEAFLDAKEAPIDKVVKPDEIRSKVRDLINRSESQKGIPFFLKSLEFEFRPHEMTLWFGHTSHGKSTVLMNQICYMASLGEMSMVASFEQNTAITFGAMLIQYTSDPDIGRMSYFDAAYDDLSSKILMYNSMSRCDPKELVATMVQAHKQLGVTSFVVDNVMTLDVDRQDNTSQANVADAFRVFVATYPVHLHIVAHPRKPMEGTQKPPSVSEIRGAAEWGDMPHNIILIYRDVAKHEKISQMLDDNVPYPEIRAMDTTYPDGKVIVKKQRETGDLPMTSYWFNKATKRSYRDQNDLKAYWSPEMMVSG